MTRDLGPEKFSFTWESQDCPPEWTIRASTEPHAERSTKRLTERPFDSVTFTAQYRLQTPPVFLPGYPETEPYFAHVTSHGMEGTTIVRITRRS